MISQNLLIQLSEEIFRVEHIGLGCNSSTLESGTEGCEFQASVETLFQAPSQEKKSFVSVFLIGELLGLFIVGHYVIWKNKLKCLLLNLGRVDTNFAVCCIRQANLQRITVLR